MQKAQSSNVTQYKCAQVFGYKSANDKIQEQDIISSMKFDPTGRFLALGDRAGRIIIFETPETKKKPQTYEYHAEFQSHVRQFDPLRSMEVDEVIKDMSWLKPQGKYLKMATTNSKQIKLWKIFERHQKKVVKSGGKELNMPKIQTIQSSLVATTQYQFINNSRKAFPCQHTSEINSISLSGNEEYMVSSDDVQVFLWSMEKSDQPFMVVDMLQKQKIEEVKQTITCSKFHPVSDSLFLFGTNKGTLRVGDLRSSALCDSGVTFKADVPGPKNFFTEMISSYSSAQFMGDCRQIISRDFLTVKIWDLANPKKPVSTITVQDSIKAKLCEMFENDAILDKFGICCSTDNSTILTGNYNNNFHLIDARDSTNSQYELSYKKATVNRQITPNKMIPLPKIDYLRKTIAGDFHPKKNSVAVSSLNCFFIYSL